MTIDQIIAQGNIHYDTTILALRYWIFWTAIFFLLVIEICVWCYSDSEIGDDESVRGGSFIIALLVFVALMVSNYITDDNHENKLIEDWKTNIATKFISNISETKSEIVYIKIDPELSSQTYGSLFYTYSIDVKLTPLTISFKGNGVETYTNWYDTKMDLTNEDTPYVTYKRLNKDLGHDINAGIYDVKVYLPKSYKFTDIK